MSVISPFIEKKQNLIN